MAATPTTYAGIRVETDSAPGNFYSAVVGDLQRLASGAIGGDLLDLLAKRSQGVGIDAASVDGLNPIYPYVTISFAASFAETAAKTEKKWQHYVRRKGRFGVFDRPFRAGGGGHFMWVSYHPNTPGQNDGEVGYTAVQGIRTPPFIVLAHELIHAWHGMSGMMETKDTQTITVPGGAQYELAREEAFTVGLGPYTDTRISENAIRAEHRLPRRDYYGSPNDFAVFAPQPHRPGHAVTGGALAAQGAKLRSVLPPNSPNHIVPPHSSKWRPPSEPPRSLDEEDWW